VVTRIMRQVEDDPSTEIVIDVVDRRVAVPAIDLDEPFDLTDFHHYRLLEGLDDIGLTLRHITEIDAFEATRPTYTPRVVSA
jgi:3-isopropylmalate/(R)-2-methylmalate dehydratase small subunit